MGIYTKSHKEPEGRRQARAGGRERMIPNGSFSWRGTIAPATEPDNIGGRVGGKQKDGAGSSNRVSAVRHPRPSLLGKTMNDRVKLHHPPDFVDRAYLVFL